MRVLVLGADGMAGHVVLRHLAARHEAFGSTRSVEPTALYTAEISPANIKTGLDARDFDQFRLAIQLIQPEAVINCIGIVKQRTSDNIAMLEVNSLFPHRLALLCSEVGSRLIHLSTDCVFSGRRGLYTEADLPDPSDFYGVSKLAGEVTPVPALTLRTSIIGLELVRRTSLIEWSLRQTISAPGYTKAIFSGLTTQELARLLDLILVSQPDLTGLWHVASTPISKYHLLGHFYDQLGRTVTLVPSDEVDCDRSLDGSRFSHRTGYVAPSWSQMLAELALEVHERERLYDVGR